MNGLGGGPVRYTPYENSESAFLIHTSGTASSTDKPVLLSERALNAVGACFARMDALTLLEKLVCGLVVYLSNVYGAVDQVVHLPLRVGGTITMCRRFSSEFYETIPAARVNISEKRDSVRDSVLCQKQHCIHLCFGEKTRLRCHR